MPGVAVRAEHRQLDHRVRLEWGREGGAYEGERSGRWDATPLPGPISDLYGCGDSFAVSEVFSDPVPIVILTVALSDPLAFLSFLAIFFDGFSLKVTRSPALQVTRLDASTRAFLDPIRFACFLLSAIMFQLRSSSPQ